MAYFSSYDVFICILSLITYIADAVTDVLLIIYLFLEGHAIWGSLSLCFFAVATLFMQIFSFHWHASDKSLTWKTFIIHMLFLAPIHRYIGVLRLGLKSRSSRNPEDLDKAYRGLNDISILRLFETFLESAPQLVLQLYIITSDIGSLDPLVGVSCLFSFLSVAWAVTAYADTLHLTYKKLYKRRALPLITHTVWQAGMIMSRVAAIVLFATVFKALVAIPLVLHAVAMMVWIAVLNPDFGSNNCEKGMFMLVAAIIHTFCFLNLKDGQSRWRMLFYYTVCFVENVALVSLWYAFNDTDQPQWMNPAGFTAVLGGFVVGVVSLCVYYCCCHPSGPAPMTEHPKLTFQRSQSFNKKPDKQVKQPIANNQLPIFNVSSSSAAMINHWIHASLDLTKEGLVQNPDNYIDTNLHSSYEGQGDRSNMAPKTDNTDWSRTVDNTFCNKSSSMYTEQSSSRSHNLIEMFSHCKQDPSSTSFNSTLLHDGSNPSLPLPSDNGYFYDPHDCSPREHEPSYYTQRLKGFSNYVNTPPVGGRDSLEFSPIQISPLDPCRMLEESQAKCYMYSHPTGLDNVHTEANAMESTPVLSVKPDIARGITRLSLSCTNLNTDDNSLSQIADRKCYDYSYDASFFRPPGQKDVSPVYLSKPLKSAESVSFSNLSLPLPDGSGNQNRRSTQSIEHHPSYVSLDRTRLSSNSRPSYSKKRSPTYNAIKNRSVDSFYTMSPVDKQLSYLSDKGISTSDQVLSLSGSTTNRSHRSLTSSGFQSEESDFSSPPSIMHSCYGVNVQNQFQSTPILENEISSIHEMPPQVRVHRPRESMDADVYTGLSEREKVNSPEWGAHQRTFIKEKQGHSVSMKNESLESTQSPSLPPLTISSRRSSSAGSGGSSRFFKDLTDTGEPGSQCEESSDNSGTQSVNSSRKTRHSTYNERSSLSAYLSNVSSSFTGNAHSSDESISLCADSDKWAARTSLQCMPQNDYEQTPRRKSTTNNYENSEHFITPTDQEIYNKGKGSSPDNPPPSSGQSEQNDSVFSRESWRASLDKEMKKKLVHDLEKLAPRKLYQLREKSNVRKMSPVTISEYNDSPYKFRRAANRQSDYVNIDKSSPASLGSAFEHMHILTPGVYTDYENVYNLNSLRTGNCPLVRPESLSDSKLLDEQCNSYRSSPRLGVVVSQPCSSYVSKTRSPPMSLDPRAVTSPINTSGVNSAFKPVKSRRSVDSEMSGNDSGTRSVLSDGPSVNSSGSNVFDNSETSVYENHSGVQSTSFPADSRHQLVHSRELSSDTTSYSNTALSFNTTGLTPVNYLKLAGTAPFSFSMASYPGDEGNSKCSSTHSYSNSIPWEDQENHSSSIHSYQDKSGSLRQPLRSLENTPVFSPIYGVDNTRDLELVSRKRFMSTPKLSTGSEKLSTQTPTGGVLNPHTPRRRFSNGYKTNETYSNDTSTWSAYNSTSGQEWALEPNERSSLSKTTYI